jgi:hypothetical protein
MITTQLLTEQNIGLTYLEILSRFLCVNENLMLIIVIKEQFHLPPLKCTYQFSYISQLSSRIQRFNISRKPIFGSDPEPVQSTSHPPAISFPIFLEDSP